MEFLQFSYNLIQSPFHCRENPELKMFDLALLMDHPDDLDRDQQHPEIYQEQRRERDGDISQVRQDVQ
jgi:hypothetical protein